MRGWLGVLVIALGLAGVSAPPASAAADYPEEMRAWLGTVAPGRQNRIDEWWNSMPSYFKDALMAAPFEDWRDMIYCDYLGFRAGTAKGAECVQMRKDDWQRNASQWSADGQYVGPSRECLRRNQTDKWGRLICVTDERREEVQEWWNALPRDVKLKMFGTPATEWEAVLSCRERGFEVGTSANKECADNYGEEGEPLY